MADTIVLADCVEAFLKESERITMCGDYAFIVTDFEDNGITSPPEQLWYAAAKRWNIERYAAIYPQYEIGSYRVDFMIDVMGYYEENIFLPIPNEVMERLTQLAPKYVIEIDGFEWHDKTPEQAERDKRRERIITQAGYRILRYAAREVLRNPMDCVMEVNSLCLEALNELRTHLQVQFI